MTKKKALVIILVFSIAGLLFSGYLSYYELFAGGCGQAIISCGPKPVFIAGIPACVYGFFMYLAVFFVSILGLRNKK